MKHAVMPDQNRRAFACGRVMAATPDSIHTVAQQDDRQEGLVSFVTRRSEFLTQYQNANYAARYTATLTSLTMLPKDIQMLAAKSLFKLMAYKDEYEVARLHSDARFHEQLKVGFEGDFTVHYHLAPPLLPRRKDARGRPKKSKFGPWVTRAFVMLAQLRAIRGQWYDPFAYHPDRRLERALIPWFEAILNDLPALWQDGHKEATRALAAAPMDIRGYGPVKDAAVQDVRARAARILAETR